MEKISTLLWDELVNLPVNQPMPELLGLLEALPHDSFDGDIVISCPKLIIGRRLMKLWKGLNEEQFNATITIDDGALQLDRKNYKARFKISKVTFNRLTSYKNHADSKDRWAWFRGVWGGSGAIYLPQSGYYMSLHLKEKNELGKKIAKVLHSVDIQPRIRIKQGRTEYTIRDQEQIVTCLTKMGLFRSSLFLEETAVVRGIRSRANKLVNCDTANINKSLSAARQQQALVDRLDDEGLWNRLPPKLIELAKMRRANPSASLSELGQLLSIPVSKSTVEYRWRRLEALLQSETI